MNRLKKFILELDRNDEKYSKIYEGPLWDPVIQQEVNDPTYWDEDIGYQLQRSSKFTLDQPCILIHIPVEKFKLSKELDHVLFADHVYRKFMVYLDEINEEIWNQARPKEESGFFYYIHINNEIHLRNASYIAYENEIEYLIITILFQAPYHNNKKMSRLLCTVLPKQVSRFLQEFDINQLYDANDLYYLQNRIRRWLQQSEYCAFVANDSILTDVSSVGILPFKSPGDLQIELCGIKGMGIRKGITVITGGGYSGKSTLLEAINAGIYNHIGGDGRELVITDDTAVFIAAEDGRSVNKIDISPFIQWMPNGDTSCFSTKKASGSTSQAANIIEAIEAGSKLLLIDEDKSATNFMIRDAIMDEIITKEPIIPFTDRVRQIYSDCGSSSVLVVGGSGEFLSVADTIIKMEDFLAFDITKKVQEVIEKYPMRLKNNSPVQTWAQKRKYISYNGFSTYPEKCLKERVKISEFGTIILGDEIIKTDRIYNITSMEQVKAIALILRTIQNKGYGREKEWVDIESAIDKLYVEIEDRGIEEIYTNSLNLNRWLELPRKIEVYGVINRMKHVKYIVKVKVIKLADS